MPAQHLIEDARRASGPAIAIRIPARVMGAIALGLVAIVMLALATWSVDDPSFSYASGEPARNWLGFPGAVIADISFQVFGLGILVLLVPPALWGWAMVRQRIPSRMALRVPAWVGSSILVCGVFGFIAAPESWPLPTGLGGLIGQSFTNLATLATGEAPQPVTAVLFAIIIAAPTLALFWIAMGLGKVTLPDLPKATKGKARTASAKAAPVVDDRDDGPDRDSVFDVILGAAVHLGFSARAAVKRASAHIAERRAAEREADAWRGEAVEPSLHNHAPSVPVVQPEAPFVEHRSIVGAHEEPPFDDYPEEPEEDGLGAARWEMQTPLRGPMANRSPGPIPHAPAAHPSAATASPRVAAPAPRVQQGTRAAREAQGSLLDEQQGFELPALSLLTPPKHKGASPEHAPERLEAMARKLESVLADFGVKGDIINVRPGPVVTLYELEPAPGIKSSRVISLADDIARSMSAISVRVAVVPGRNAIGIELPNEVRETVYLREMLASSDFEKMKGKLPICLGKTIGGEPIIADLARMPHLLIAGTTGSGKSVGINTFILSLLYQMTPEQCRLIMIDPKMLELSIYDGIPHLLTPVVTDPSKAVVALKWAVREMEDRYRKMSKIGVRNIDGFNQRVGESKAKGEVITRTVQTGFDRETGEAIFESEEFNLEPLPFIVIIIDEMADLMMVAGKEIEGSVQRLAQMARAAGIHVITATQRPSVDVITGTIKANFPTRISFMVTSKIDSRTILGEQGAEQLLGNGDMLYMAGGGRIRRLHGPFVADSEVESVVNHLKSQGAPDYLESITADEDELDEDGMVGGGDDYGGSGDELYDKAVNVVLQDKKVSTSYIQRRLAIGYNKAATLIERMEREGVISAANHAGKREILVGNNADGY
ncbi:DNA translocase FtsK [Devosia sp. ZB163]|uniref:DNA translocase FtsK n=1 Tax=Devosia sp. ZB163 TaxID=3025938 RepID=UPI00236157C6|nr:DNA translocase FtsK [Devosia sp. ZB163]MDC9822407.1 DNA translocase FtsK [Devosia sp. ZB163]